MSQNSLPSTSVSWHGPRRLVGFALFLLSLPQVAALAQSAPAAAPEAATTTPPALRLDGAVRPERYAVHLRLDPAETRFEGSVEIRLQIERALDLLWLHATELRVEEAELDWQGDTLEVAVVDGGESFAGFRLPQAVGPGEAVLRVSYSGQISDRDSSGLFRRQEGDDWYLFSQFEPVAARRAFPCFDEPNYKVPWQLTLTVPEGFSAVTNTPGLRARTRFTALRRGAEPVEDERGSRGWTEIEFAPTPPLPSYLVALAVGPFEAVELGRIGAGKTPVRILTPRGRIERTTYVQGVMPPILEQLEDYFGSPYPFAKLDSVAIPQTFGFAAMENPGLVTYNERLLVADAAEETVSFRRSAASVIAHELAHQWFGNLVTNAWWDEIWLNESFATWMSGKVLERLWPEWQPDVQRERTRQQALAGDFLLSARRIRQPIESPADIFNAFDGVSYGKGGSLLAMLEAWIGETGFREGIRAYLRDHAWGNATAADLVGALAAASGEPALPAVFDSFLDQVGAPRLDVTLTCAEEAPARLELRQERLLPDGTPSTGQHWVLPVCAAFPAAGGGRGRACTVVSEATGELVLPAAAGCPAWVLANEGSRGYYVAAYEPAVLAALLAPEGGPELQLGEVVGLLGDAGRLVDAGHLPAGVGLQLAAGSAPAEHWAVAAAAARLAQLPESLTQGETAGAYARFVERLFGQRARELGWTAAPADDDARKQLRAALVPLVADLGEDEVLQAAAGRQAQAWLANPEAVDAENLDALLAVAARGGDTELFDALVSAVDRLPERRDRERVYRALGAFDEPDLTARALALVLEEGRDAREAMGLLFAATMRQATRGAAWDFMEAHFAALVERLPRETHPFLPYAGAGFCDAAGRQRVETLFGPRTGDLVGSERTLRQVLEIIDACQKRRERQGDAVAAFLARQDAAAAAGGSGDG